MQALLAFCGGGRGSRGQILLDAQLIADFAHSVTFGAASIGCSAIVDMSSNT